MGIIGIVAALTISNNIANIQEKVLLTQLTHAYSLLSQATEHMLEDEQCDIKDFGESQTERLSKYIELLPKYIKVIKTCAHNQAAGKCNASTYKWLLPDGNMYVDIYKTINNRQTVVLSNGISILFSNGGNNNCGLYKNFTYDNSYNGHGGGTYGYSCAQFYVDINGKKGPNEIDKDIFLFYLVRDGIIPAGMPQETIWCNTFGSACGKNATNRYSLHNCTAWALQNKNMDYLKCNGLNWNSKQSCKD